jgi:prepilin-type N-terminal cleavage/methylation domain-containing protein
MKEKKTKKGFTMMEVVASLFVISVGLTGILGLMASNVKEAADSRDQLIAAQLAQEGLELIRNLRDTDPLSFSYNGDYNISYNTTIASATSGSYILYKSGDFYTHNFSSEATRFRRQINIASVGSPATQYNVTSYTSWDNLNPQNGANCTITNHCVSARVSLVVQ